MSKWVALTVEEATSHPSYGIKGAASFLRAASIVVPIFGLISTFGNITSLVKERGLVAIDSFIVIPYVIFFIWSGINAIFLEKKNPAFIKSFCIFVATGPFISIFAQLAWALSIGGELNMEYVFVNFSSIFLAWGIWSVAWLPYIFFSKRINVTLRNRVRKTDSFVIGKAPPTR